MSASSDSLSDKAYIEHKEDVAADVKPQQEEEAQAVDPKFAIRVRRKIDLRLIPILAALYCISLIDRCVLARRASNKRELTMRHSQDEHLCGAGGWDGQGSQADRRRTVLDRNLRLLCPVQ